jgi:hypothetical protein
MARQGPVLMVCPVLVMRQCGLPAAISASGPTAIPVGLTMPLPDHARRAADARLRFPLNLGDCFAYALARSEGCGILSLDAGFRRTDVPVTAP